MLLFLYGFLIWEFWCGIWRIDWEVSYYKGFWDWYEWGWIGFLGEVWLVGEFEVWCEGYGDGVVLIIS